MRFCCDGGISSEKLQNDNSLSWLKMRAVNLCQSGLTYSDDHSSVISLAEKVVFKNKQYHYSKAILFRNKPFALVSLFDFFSGQAQPQRVQRRYCEDCKFKGYCD